MNDRFLLSGHYYEFLGRAMDLREFLKDRGEELSIKYIKAPFLVGELPDCFILIWKGEVCKVIPKVNKD